MKENLSDNLKKGVNYTMKTIKRKIAETVFLSKSTMFYIKDKEKSKVFYGIMDEDKSSLYVRASKEKFFKDNITTNCLIQGDDSPKQYKVLQCDYGQVVDYLIKVNDKYQTVKCLRIQLENVAN